jgi:hypothetical protein
LNPVPVGIANLVAGAIMLIAPKYLGSICKIEPAGEFYAMLQAVIVKNPSSLNYLYKTYKRC